MQQELHKIAFGGGCHWCTEAVFQSLKGVTKVEQGFVASIGENTSFSEAVIVHFNPKLIPLKILVEIHLHTHKSTSSHSMREKYRSAVYTFNKAQNDSVVQFLNDFQEAFQGKLITKVLKFKGFKPSEAQFQNYYYTNPNKPFCETYINPKLKMLLTEFTDYVAIKNKS